MPKRTPVPPLPGASLRYIMEKNGLTYRDVSEILCVSPKTVESWLADPSSAMYRAMPQRHLAIMPVMLQPFLARRRSAKKTQKNAAKKEA